MAAATTAVRAATAAAARRCARTMAAAFAVRSALRAVLRRSLPDYRRRHPDRLRTAAVRRGRRVRTVSRVGGPRITGPRRIRTAGTRLSKALPSAAGASIRSVTARATIGGSRLRWYIRGPPCATRRSAAQLPRPRRSRAGSAPPSAGRPTPRTAARYRGSRGLPAELLHGPLLLGERNPLHRRRRAAAEKVRVLGTVRNARHRAARIPQTRGARRHRQLAAHQASLMHLGAGSPRDIAESSLPEIRRGNRRNTVGHTRVSIYVCDIYVGNIHATVEESGIAKTGIEPTAPPRIKGLKRRQRDPSDIPEPETYAYAWPESKETHQRGRPVMRVRNRPDTSTSRKAPHRTSGRSEMAPNPRGRN